jgi:signal transduction histidine kinase/CheY-like chemotaxis protein
MEQKRILVVDDNEAIHYDFRKALEINKSNSELEGIRNKLFPVNSNLPNIYTSYPSFIIDSAYQGLEAIELLKKNIVKGQRYALAFIDMLMPPGIDGITTIEQLWAIDPDLQIVICTAHTDASYEEIYQRLKGSDNFLILKKPFDIIEILQMVSSLTRKWELDQQARLQLKKQSDRLHYFFQEADFLYRLSQLSQTVFSTKEAMQFYIDGICSLRDWPIGHIYRAEQNEDNTVNLHSTDIWYVKDKDRFIEYQELVRKTVFESGEGLPGLVLQSKKAYWIENIKFDDSFLQVNILVKSGIRGALAVPIKLYDTVIAVVEFFSEQPIHKNQQLLDLTTAAANQLGLLLERRRNEKELKQNYEQLQALYKEMQNTQAQLLQHAKLVSIGQLAAGVAHEINNPIAYVTSNTEILRKNYEIFKELFNHLNSLFSQTDPSLQKHWKEVIKTKNLDFLIKDCDEILKESLEGLERVRDIVADLKSFSHTDEAEVQEENINHCLDVTIKMIWNELKYKCTVIKDYGQLPPLRCYARQLNQVFMNLLVNASQAINNQGEITITTRHLDDAIHITIQDTGEGIAPENMEKLFDPFFTTKPVGTGTGLGLSISYNIIKKHKGQINVTSELGKGTRFTIILPLPGVQ